MPLVIAKTVLPDAQRFYLALGRIFGIGKVQGLAIAEQVGISKEARVADLKQHHVQQVSLTWHVISTIRHSGLLCHLVFLIAHATKAALAAFTRDKTVQAHKC